MTQQNGSFSINDSASPRSLTSQMTHFTSTLIILIKCSSLDFNQMANRNYNNYSRSLDVNRGINVEAKPRY